MAAPFRLGRVLEVRRAQARAAEGHLAHTIRQRTLAADAHVRAAGALTRAVDAQRALLGGGPVGVMALRDAHADATGAREGVARATREHQRADGLVDRALDAAVEARRVAAGLERLRVRHDARERVADRRREADEADEITMGMIHRRRARARRAAGAQAASSTSPSRPSR